ncbi:MAG TPA: glucose 1-dehydrogenase [Terriglobia bacterium]|nr:glucose 1-dehydrogenase [Terriglobia bacterium]
MSLAGKVAIITGGGTGIGFGIARVLASKGIRLVLAQRRLEMVERAVTQLADAETLALSVDISDYAEVQRLVDATLERFGQVDILVNNSSLTGMPVVSPMLDCPPAKVDQIVDVNLKGTFYCSQAVAKRMTEAGRGGNIVHISSVGAYAAQEFASLYCATKAAQVSLAKSMALELAPYNIRVNCVAPGDIYTEASATITEDKQHGGASGRYPRVTPLGRRGHPEDIGHAVAYLVSDEARFVTGTTLLVDGGFLTY